MVTGAAGSIGGEISRQLLRYSFEKLILIDQAESALYDLQQELLQKGCLKCEFIIANIKNLERMRSLMEYYRPDLVFHSAAYKHVPLMEENPYEAVMTNVKGTKNMADLANEFGTEKFVLISTDKAVNPTNVMGATKRIAELYVTYLNAHSNCNYVVTRFETYWAQTVLLYQYLKSKSKGWTFDCHSSRNYEIFYDNSRSLSTGIRSRSNG